MGCTVSDQTKAVICKTVKAKDKESDPVRKYLESNENNLPNRLKELFQKYFMDQVSTPLSVDLRFINLSGVQIKPLIFILPYLPQIQELILWKTLLNNNGCISLCKVIKHLPNLVALSLADNEISYPGVHALTEQFGNFPKLERLELHINQFGTESCTALAANFAKLHEIRVITLDECEMSGEGLVELINSLPLLKKLERVSMDYNYFGEESNNLLVGVINKMKKLKRMSLANAGVNLVTQDALKVVYPFILFTFN